MTDDITLAEAAESAPLAVYTCHTPACEMDGVPNALPLIDGLVFYCGPCGTLIEDVVKAAKGTTPGVQPSDLDS